VLKLAVLGLLKDQQLHGYELKRQLTEVLGPFSSVSFGSLYPALARLEAAGSVVAVDVEADNATLSGPLVPMTGSMAGEAAAYRTRRSATRRSARTRKVYAITPAGEQIFAELLDVETGDVDDDRAFTLKLAFCRFLSPERRLGFLELRRAHLVERLARSRNCARARRERMDSYTRSLIDHGTEATEHDISWLDRLIAIERQGGKS